MGDDWTHIATPQLLFLPLLLVGGLPRGESKRRSNSALDLSTTLAPVAADGVVGFRPAAGSRWRWTGGDSRPSSSLHPAFESLVPEHVSRQLKQRGATAAHGRRSPGDGRRLCTAHDRPHLGWVADLGERRQGGSSGPELRNHMVAGPLAESHAEVKGRLWPAVSWNDKTSMWSLLAWADNVFRVAASWEQAIERARCYGSTLAAFELSISPSSGEAPANLHASAVARVVAASAAGLVAARRAAGCGGGGVPSSSCGTPVGSGGSGTGMQGGGY